MREERALNEKGWLTHVMELMGLMGELSMSVRSRGITYA
jgi:hypothetical protein